MINQRLQYKLYIKEHLADLNRLSKSPVSEKDLKPVSDTEKYRKLFEEVREKETTKHIIYYADFSSPKMDDYFSRLKVANPTSVSVWAKRVEECGVAEIPDIAKVDTKVDFPMCDGSLVSFITFDGRDQLLLDVCVSKSGVEVIEVEVRGCAWSAVPFPNLPKPEYDE